VIVARARRIGKWWRVAAVVLAGAIMSLSGIRSWPDQARGMRSGNRTDEFYRYVAQQLDEPVLCDRIPWSVESPGGFFTEPSYERSACYDFIAGRTRNPWLCWNVKRLGAFSWLSSQTSMWTCLDHAVHGWNGGIGIAPADLVRFFEQMGYDPDRLHLEGITPPIVSVKDLYRQLPARPDIATRIERATGASEAASSSNPGHVVNVAYLADMAALVTQDSGWCFRIPDDLPLVSEPSRFRDWCLFTLATNTRNAELCRRIPVGANQTDARMSLREQCGFQVNSPHPSNLHYGPEVPADDDRARALISALNYQIPRARDLPPESIYAAYDRFLDELRHGTDQPHLTARRRFIDRVQRLPEAN
jgi:hypothetical protein